MIIYPAIDLYNNRVVRLYQGEYAKKTEYDMSPIDLAASFKDQGADWVHIVDLEAAEKGYPVHLSLIEKIVSKGIKVQFGGGLRSISNIDTAMQTGASRVYAGSLLAKDPEAAQQLFESWGNRIIPAVDIKNNKVAVSGWRETIEKGPYPLLSFLFDTGFREMLITSVVKDGTFMGPDLTLYCNIQQKMPQVQIIAAGGISSIQDVLKLKEQQCSGVVIGKSLYEGKICLKKLLEVIN